MESKMNPERNQNGIRNTAKLVSKIKPSKIKPSRIKVSGREGRMMMIIIIMMMVEA